MDTGLSRRGLFGVGAVAASVLAGVTPASAATGTSRMTLRWWGNNSWEIVLPGVTILIDPWLTRFKTGTYTPAGADPRTPLTVNRALIDGYLDRGFLRAKHILVTHGHYDHLTDVPYLAKRTGATVIGTETHLSLMAALGTPEDQLAIASGGEDLTFDGYAVRVLRSLHSAVGARAQVPFPGSRPLSRRDRPRVIADLVEGGTLAYAVSGGGASVLNFGGSNYVESELAGLRPDVLLLPVGGAKVTQYVPRLLRVLGNPRYVAATHWDDFDLPLGQAHDPNGGLEVLRKAVAAASPASEFVVLDHLGSFTP
ncbi:MBL fold metallo-hydrolase [Amycolatopsis australiensis]|uniref:L-ascorbate metabolism protein UlaG, beta-lactamase superfamily n=1 Tax=Amycolatopsis australiensis TaxID=546364 RepID=A0A1K1RI33_9PSEU|nr:MBL fold metallo-hydrolase [Amycolatopsis australiensis]SFW71839.1 L-ascorbate metabolism protein UlaG, beta-lactamase superfamily [Amycolatopsis australiensis]